MKSFPFLYVVLTTALSNTALATPAGLRVRHSDNSSDTSAICQGTTPSLVSTSSYAVSGNTTLEISMFSCTTSPFVAAHRSGDFLGGLLGGLLGWLFPPCPPFVPTKRPKPPKTVTSTATATVTSVSVSTSVSATTVTEVSTATEITTATETDTSTVTSTITAAPPASTATDVCGEICTIVCAAQGRLPPVTEDCQALVNSITILNGQIPPEFSVDANHVQMITFGTCSFFFENVGPDSLTYCWLSLTQVASAAEAACLPPTQPVMSEGLCVPSSGLWEVGVAHA